MASLGGNDNQRVSLEAAKAELTIAQSNFTRRLKSGNRQVAAARDVPSLATSEQLAVLNRDLHLDYNKLIDALDKISIECGTDDGNWHVYESSKDDTQKKYDDMVQDILATQHDIQALQPRPNLALKPAPLTLAHTPAELRIWKRKFKSYYTSSHFQMEQVNVQQEYFRMCLSKRLENKYFASLDETIPILSNDSTIKTCYSILDEAWLQEYPMIVRRCQFFALKQKPNQLFSEFVAELESLGLEADIANMTAEDILIVVCINGCNDDDLRRKFLECPLLSWAKIEQIARSHEAEAEISRVLAEDGLMEGRSSRPFRRPAPKKRGRKMN